MALHCAALRQRPTECNKLMVRVRNRVYASGVDKQMLKRTNTDTNIHTKSIGCLCACPYLVDTTLWYVDAALFICVLDVKPNTEYSFVIFDKYHRT